MTALKLVIILFLLQLGIFCFVTFRPYAITPPGHTYTEFSKNYFFPIFFYPNMILQAKDGAWSIKDTHTTLPQQRVYGQWFFIITGKLAALTHGNQTVLYILSQIAGAAALFAVTYILISHVLPKSFHVLAVLFALTLELGPTPNFFGRIASLPLWTPAINDYILLFRHFDLPHHVWAEVFGFCSLLLTIVSYRKATPLRIAGLFVVTCLSVWCVPSIMLTLWLVVYPVFFLWTLFTKTVKKFILPACVGFIATALAGIQTKIAFTAAGVPWISYSDEKSWVSNITITHQYVSSLLIYLPFLLLFCIMFPIRWKHWSSNMQLTVLLLLAWVLTPFLGIPLSALSFFPIANFRFVIGPEYISAGILSAVGLVETVKFIRRINIRKTVLAVVTGLTIGFSLYVTSVYLHSFLLYQDQLDSHAYPATTTWKGMLFLRTVPVESGIMVREQFGEMIPGFADVRVYIGGHHGYPDWLQRQANAITFFSGAMTEEEAKNFLTSNDISYVFYGPDEQAVTTQSPLYPDILKPVFHNETVTIYSL